MKKCSLEMYLRLRPTSKIVVNYSPMGESSPIVDKATDVRSRYDGTSSIRGLCTILISLIR